MNIFNQTGLYRKKQIWVMMSMLMLVIIIPTICLLWFVSEAVRNERMAMRQRVTELYKARLESLQPMLRNFWEQRLFRLSQISNDRSPAERFKKMIESGSADSVIIYNTEGELLYPSPPESSAMDLSDQAYEWIRAEELELKSKNYLAAARMYLEVAINTRNTDLAGKALQSHVRCLAAAGKKRSALSVVSGIMSSPRYNTARDCDGRLILPDAQLYVIKLSGENPGWSYNGVMEGLVSRLRDYSKPGLPPSQRLFLMQELKLIRNDMEFSTLAAEQLASVYVQQLDKVSGENTLEKIPGKDLWKTISSDGTVLGIFKGERVLKETQVFIDANSKISIDFIPKDSKIYSASYLKSPAGDYFPDWELTVHMEDDDLQLTASKRTVYLWTAFLIITGIFILSVLTVRLFLRQMSLARLKNDLITTVSHELKTPLSSIRVLVDTLMDGKYQDENLVKNYIELIAKENERLSRLVENFLTFSRIEDKRQTFDFREIEPANVVRSAYDTMKHRFESGGFSFEVTIPEKTPALIADQDALIMALLNLLENAFQYSGDTKSVILALYSENGNISFEVRDKGVGLSLEEKKKILEPFYQVDQTLSRKSGGFGLGLSIVKSIIDIHRGSINIDSEKGNGSTFTITIPLK